LKIKVRIEAGILVCNDQEDELGDDEIYLLGGLSDGVNNKEILTTPIAIHNGQSLGFEFYMPESQWVLFDAEADERAIIKGGVKLMDEDYAKDWSKHSEWAGRIVNAVAIVVAGVGGPPGAVAAAIIKGAYEAFNGVASADKDDDLGTQPLEIPASGNEAELLYLKFKGRHPILGGFSEWDYNVYLRLSRKYPKLSVRVDPDPIPVGQQVQVTVYAEDADSHVSVPGKVYIDDREVANTGEPFNITFDSRTWGKVKAPDYLESSFPFNVLLRRMNVQMNPDPQNVPLNRQIQVTINTSDRENNARVDGRVQIIDTNRQPTDPPQPEDGFPTNVPFDYIFRRKPREASAARAIITAARYETESIYVAAQEKDKEEKEAKEEKETKEGKEARKEKEGEGPDERFRERRMSLDSRSVAMEEEDDPSGKAFIQPNERHS
jgi:hypothetical protein